MIPYLLAIAGGYLIGSAMKSEEYAKGGTIQDKIDKFKVSDLDMYEEFVYNDMIKKGRTKTEALMILINNVEGDFSQLSPKLRKIALEMENEMTGELEGERRMGMDYAKGGMTKDKWIQEAVKNKGALRRTAKREGLIKGDEKLSMSDIKKLEKKGGKTAKRAYLAETLKKMK